MTSESVLSKYREDQRGLLLYENHDHFINCKYTLKEGFVAGTMNVELNARNRKILFAAVTEFISTGDPVGSRTLARKYNLDLSPATIRNVLSDLEEAGFLYQPHTSAGRIPTHRAFRIFIDALMQMRDLSESVRQTIETHLTQLEPNSNFLRETAQLLSKLTGTAAVVVSPKFESHQLKQLRFISTKPGLLLAVIVTSAGVVENRFIQVDRTPTNDELTRIHNLLDDVLEDRTLREVRELFARRLQDARNELGTLRRHAFELGQQALDATRNEVDIIIEGQTQLFDKPEFADIERIKQLVHVLEEREELVAILDKTLDSKGVYVMLSEEHEAPPLGVEQLSVVSARYGIDDNQSQNASGSISILGPTRMDYASIVPIVNETARAINGLLSRRETRKS